MRIVKSTPQRNNIIEITFKHVKIRQRNCSAMLIIPLFSVGKDGNIVIVIVIFLGVQAVKG